MTQCLFGNITPEIKWLFVGVIELLMFISFAFINIRTINGFLILCSYSIIMLAMVYVFNRKI